MDYTIFFSSRPHISDSGSFDLDVNGLAVTLKTKLGEFIWCKLEMLELLLSLWGHYGPCFVAFFCCCFIFIFCLIHVNIVTLAPILSLYNYFSLRLLSMARFKRRATAVPNSIDRIKFDFSTAVARRLKPSRATAV